MRNIGSTGQNISEHIPGILNCLQKVFWVMGGYIFATGLLTFFVSLASFRIRARGAFATVADAGITSIGLMTAVNFMIGSDFRWVLLAFTLPYITALILYRLHK